MKRALFLDRDGVVNVERNYVHQREAFQFQQGVFELCRAAQALGYILIVITNQAGIARGYYTESDFLNLTEWMIERFAEELIDIARVYYCPYHPIHGVGRYKYDSPDRKPNPGMLLRAQADFNLDMGASVLIGDQDSDIRAGRSAGVGTRILLRPPVSDLRLQQDECFLAESLDQVRLRFLNSVPRETDTDGCSFHRTSNYD